MTPIRTIQGHITGSLHMLSFFMLKLEIKNGENLFIQYGKYNSFFPCSIMYSECKFYLHAAGLGGAKDVRVEKNVFLIALAKMGSVEILNNWVEVIAGLNKRELVTV